MKKTLSYIASILILIIFSSVSNGQNLNLKKEVIQVKEFDTDDCIEFVTDNASLFVKKDLYLTKYAEDHKNNKEYIDAIRHSKKAKICLIFLETPEKEICNGHIKTDDRSYEQILINKELVELIFSGDCSAILHESRMTVAKMKAEKKAFNEKNKVMFIRITDKKTKTVLLNSLYHFK